MTPRVISVIVMTEKNLTTVRDGDYGWMVFY